MTPDDTRHGSKAQRETAEDNLQDAHQRLEDYGKTVDFLASAAIEDHELTLPWLDELGGQRDQGRLSRIKFNGKWVDQPVLSDGRQADGSMAVYALPRWWVWR